MVRHSKALSDSPCCTQWIDCTFYSNVTLLLCQFLTLFQILLAYVHVHVVHVVLFSCIAELGINSSCRSRCRFAFKSVVDVLRNETSD